jgi:putative (di)nucleoside polyphosphate hydrolase
MSDSYAHLPYRPCIGLVILNKDNKIFIGKRLDTPSHLSNVWQMPQGGIDAGEDIETALYRELFEETGIARDKVSLRSMYPEKLIYDLPDNLIGKIWGGQFRGQEQTWVYLNFLGKDSDININAHSPAEFQDWQWADKETVLKHVVPFKKETYERILLHVM